MSTLLNATSWNYADVVARLTNGREAIIANSLARNLTLLSKAQYVEATDRLQNCVVKYVDLGTTTRKRANQGIAASKTSTITEKDPITKVATRIQIEEDVWNSAPDKDRLLAQEISGKSERMRQDVSTAIYYDNPSVDIDATRGLALRLNSLTQPTVRSAGGSSGALTSMYVLTHDSANGFYLHYPKASTAGMQFLDRGTSANGLLNVADSSGNEMFCKVYDIIMAFGVSLANDRMAARVANIPVATLSKTGSNSGGSGADLEDELLNALIQMQNFGDTSRQVFADRSVNTFLARQFQKKSNHWITRQEYEQTGTLINYFNGVPVFVDEAIRQDEAVVS